VHGGTFTVYLHGGPAPNGTLECCNGRSPSPAGECATGPVSSIARDQAGRYKHMTSYLSECCVEIISTVWVLWAYSMLTVRTGTNTVLDM
jgi:hypothetical protein